jgi:hypothetical protein
MNKSKEHNRNRKAKSDRHTSRKVAMLATPPMRKTETRLGTSRIVLLVCLAIPTFLSLPLLSFLMGDHADAAIMWTPAVYALMAVFLGALGGPAVASVFARCKNAGVAMIAAKKD